MVRRLEYFTTLRLYINCLGSGCAFNVILNPGTASAFVDMKKNLLSKKFMKWSREWLSVRLVPASPEFPKESPNGKIVDPFIASWQRPRGT